MAAGGQGVLRRLLAIFGIGVDTSELDKGKKKVKLVSHGMLLATGPSEDLRLATVDGDAAPGARLK